MDTYVEALRKGGHTVGMCGDGAFVTVLFLIVGLIMTGMQF